MSDAAQVAEHRDHTGARIGMWLFLLTELLLFGGLFLLYAIYRSQFSSDFHYAAGTLDTTMGAVNTLVLLTSSLTMVLSVAALSKQQRKLSAVFLSLTIAAGLVFMINKYFEWSAKLSLGLYPNSPELLRHTPGENLFYGLYYAMTGLHGLHVIVGIGVLSVMLVFVGRRPRRAFQITGLESAQLRLVEGDQTRWRHLSTDTPDEAQLTLIYEENEDVSDLVVGRLENSGLYWHLVDVIWIFLFPLFYLIS